LFDIYFAATTIAMKKHMREFISNTVHILRQEKGATQEDLAAVVGVSRQTIIAIERGNYTPSVMLALKIAKYFGTSVEEIFIISKRH
jgi:putative transcriptional regulator